MRKLFFLPSFVATHDIVLLRCFMCFVFFTWPGGRVFGDRGLADLLPGLRRLRTPGTSDVNLWDAWGEFFLERHTQFYLIAMENLFRRAVWKEHPSMGRRRSVKFMKGEAFGLVFPPNRFCGHGQNSVVLCWRQNRSGC